MESAKIGEEAVLRCTVKMNPPMDSPSESVWSWGKKGNKTELITGENTVEGYTAEMAVCLQLAKL